MKPYLYSPTVSSIRSCVVWGTLDILVDELFVTFGFEFVGEFAAAGFDDLAVVHHMDEVGSDVVEDALVMGD